jgi:uncharacterized membrane protein YcaP (DUF421 family)
MDVVLRSVLAFAFILLLLRVLGRRELSTMEAFDLILLVVIGDLVQQGVTQADTSVTGIALSVGTFALLAVATSWLSYRFKAARAVLEPAPVVVVENGHPIERNMRAERLTLEEIAAEARLQQIAALDDVEWAIVESSGRISFIPKGVAP